MFVYDQMYITFNRVIKKIELFIIASDDLLKKQSSLLIKCIKNQMIKQMLLFQTSI